MGYDLEPLRTLESKRQLVRDAAEQGWRLVFEHDAAVVSARVTVGAREAELVDIVHRAK
jgi:hypothetical protein